MSLDTDVIMDSDAHLESTYYHKTSYLMFFDLVSYQLESHILRQSPVKQLVKLNLKQT